VKFLFDGKGEPRAFVEAYFVYAMNGEPVGFLSGPHVHRLSDGAFVGELYQDMVVDTYTSSPGTAPAPGVPGRVPPADNPGGRGTFDYGYPCRIDALFA
jgi:hypothetical protein